MKPVNIGALLFFVLLIGCSNNPNPPNDLPTAQKPLKVFLVRHAEKVDQSEDPDLSEQGYQRASTLAAMLQSTKITQIHSSDYIRTRRTAQPAADYFGLEVEIYDPNDLESLAGQLKEKGGVHLVVGHSNTTPDLTRLLGGDPGSPINDESEYDRLYLVTISAEGSVSSTLFRYGDRYMEN